MVAAVSEAVGAAESIVTEFVETVLRLPAASTV